MNSDTLIRQLAEADDYAPEHDLPDTARTSTVALTEIRRRIDMDAKELTKPVTPDRPPRRTWLVAVAAAAAVIVIVGAAVILTGGSDDVAPATTPSTTIEGSPSTTLGGGDDTTDQATTTTAFVQPELDDDAVAYVQGLVDDLNAGDSESAAARIFSAGTFEGQDASADSQIDNRPRAAGRLAVWTELDSVVELIDCATLTDGGTRCEIARSSSFDHSSPDPELAMVQVRFDDSGALAFMRMMPVPGAWNTPYMAFERWIEDNYPELWSTIFFDFSDPARTAELTREYYPLWQEATRIQSELTDRDAAFVAEYERIVNSGDRDAFVALFAPGAGRLWSAENPIVILAERLADEMTGLLVRETTTSLDECRSIGSSVRCTVEFSGPVEQALYGGPLSGPYSFLLTDDGLIEEIRGNDGSFAPALEAGGRFLSWMRDEHPDVYAQMVPIGSRELLAESDAELWLEWAPRWAEAGRP